MHPPSQPKLLPCRQTLSWTSDSQPLAAFTRAANNRFPLPPSLLQPIHLLQLQMHSHAVHTIACLSCIPKSRRPIPPVSSPIATSITTIVPLAGAVTIVPLAGAVTIVPLAGAVTIVPLAGAVTCNAHSHPPQCTCRGSKILKIQGYDHLRILSPLVPARGTGALLVGLVEHAEGIHWGLAPMYDFHATALRKKHRDRSAHKTPLLHCPLEQTIPLVCALT